MFPFTYSSETQIRESRDLAFGGVSFPLSGNAKLLVLESLVTREMQTKNLRYQSKTETTTAPTLFFFRAAMTPIL